MGGVQPFVRDQQPADLGQFLQRGMALHDVIEPGGQPHGALFHALPHFMAYLSHLVIVECRLPKAGGQDPRVGVRQVSGRILDVTPVHLLHIVAESLPAAILLGAQPIQAAQVEHPLADCFATDRSIRDAVGHEHFAGESLGDFGCQAGTLEEPAVAVVVYIDESWGDDAPLGVDALPGRCVG